jgi:hypothetical protein
MILIRTGRRRAKTCHKIMQRFDISCAIVIWDQCKIREPHGRTKLFGRARMHFVIEHAA